MKTQLRTLWLSRSPSQRRVIIGLAAVLGMALYAWLLISGGSLRAQTQVSVGILRAQSATLEQQAHDLKRLQALPQPPISRVDLGEQIRVRADEAGVGHALVIVAAPDAKRMVVAFAAVAFPDWLDWVAALNVQQVSLAACRIDALPTPGMVKVTATLLHNVP
jgi:general secretion pathway protein M